MSSAAKQDLHVVEDGVKILYSTERAALLKFENGLEVWVPLAVCEIQAVGHGVYRVEFDHWFAVREGLV